MFFLVLSPLRASSSPCCRRKISLAHFPSQTRGRAASYFLLLPFPLFDSTARSSPLPSPLSQFNPPLQRFLPLPPFLYFLVLASAGGQPLLFSHREAYANSLFSPPLLHLHSPSFFSSASRGSKIQPPSATPERTALLPPGSFFTKCGNCFMISPPPPPPRSCPQ